MSVKSNSSQPSINGLQFQVKLLLAISFLVIFAILQEPLFLNIQLFLKKTELFPKIEYQGIIRGTIVNLIFTCIALLFLIKKWQYITSINWWVGFILMELPYSFFKWLGVYWDRTVYIIAHAEGKTIGGGAAFGHLFLIIYLMGFAQLLSQLGFRLSTRIRHSN